MDVVLVSVAQLFYFSDVVTQFLGYTAGAATMEA